MTAAAAQTPEPDPHGFSIRCSACGAGLVVERHLRTSRCPYCASTSIVERPPEENRPSPVFGFGFALTAALAQERVAQWLAARSLFTLGGVRKAKVEEVRGVYVPAYLYSSLASTAYTARIGEYYWETQVYYVKGKARTRRVRKTEWRSLAGQREEYVQDVLVTASAALPNEELERVEPFDLRMLHRYHPGLVSGWIAEDPSLSRAQCLELARQEADALIALRLKRFMPGDAVEGLQHQSRFEQEELDLCLVPLYVLSVRYHAERPPFRVIVNGQSGKAYGKAPLSWVKISLAVAAGLAAVAAAVLALGHWG